MRDLSPLLDDLRRTLPRHGFDAGSLRLEPLPDKGLAHDHVRLVGRGLLARVPKQSQMGLAAAENLRYQAACFERAAASGHAPRLHGCIDPGTAGTPLERGALLVQEIAGRPLQLPQDLPALVEALAAIHRLPLPPAPLRAPLRDDADPLAALADEIDQQARHLDAATLAPAARQAIGRVLQRWRALCAAPERPPRRLISFDAHPGNFLLTPDGRAVLVDLEKARYGPPPLDLAHATLYTSTTWDLDSHAELSLAQSQCAAELWLQRLGEADLWQPWIVPLREAMWLWAVTWCAKWRVLSGGDAARSADGEDWSADRSDQALVAHVRGRVALYLSVEGVERVVSEFEAWRARQAKKSPKIASR